jgi:hypothetical protein
MVRDADGDTLLPEEQSHTATTVIPATRRSAPLSVRSAQEYMDSAQNPEEAAHGAAVVRQAMEAMENPDLSAFSNVSQAALRGLSVQRSPSDEGSIRANSTKGGKTTALKSCLKSRPDSTTSGQ